MPHIKPNNWLLQENLEKRFNTKCFVGHSTGSMALAEHYFGGTSGCDDSILIRVHHGIGAGILVAGTLFTGNGCNVGEIGHLQVEPQGKRCYCGNIGCLETIVSNGAIEKRVRDLIGQGHTSCLTRNKCDIKTICIAANAKDPLACDVLRYTGRYLGKAISIIINLFNPKMIVLAGEITTAKEVLFPVIENCINTQALNLFKKNISIVVSELDDHSAIGAFALVKQAMLNGVLLSHLMKSDSVSVGIR